MSDNAYAIDLLRQADELLSRYRNVTGRPPFDDLTVYTWADGLTEVPREQVMSDLIDKGERLWPDDPYNTKVAQAEMDAVGLLLDRIYEEGER